jgi:hypothetical protein
MDSIPETRNHLAPMLVDAWRELRKAWAEARAYSSLLSAALAMIHERDIELSRLRDRYHALLNERRHNRTAA